MSANSGMVGLRPHGGMVGRSIGTAMERWRPTVARLPLGARAKRGTGPS